MVASKVFNDNPNPLIGTTFYAMNIEGRFQLYRVPSGDLKYVTPEPISKIENCQLIWNYWVKSF